MTDIDWLDLGRKAYEDAQPEHASPSNPEAKQLWLKGWHEAHEAAEAHRQRTIHIEGVPLRLKKIHGKIYLVDDRSEVLGDQKYVELEADANDLTWTARVTFTGLRLEE